MLFKRNLIEMIILLIIIISFAWIGVHKQMVVSYNEEIIEGMDTTKEEDEVPGCNKTVYSEYDPYSYDSKYILKTQVVPPVCPACPSVIGNHNHGDNLNDGLVNENGSSIVQESTEINKTMQVANSSNEKNTNVTNIENTTINNSAQAQPSVPTVNSSSPSPPTNNNIKSNELLKRQQSFYDNESLSENMSNICPPCPACERCPEPAFTCEKVINYKSPSAKQYLPMPVLNDFSTFPSS